MHLNKLHFYICVLLYVYCANGTWNLTQLNCINLHTNIIYAKMDGWMDVCFYVWHIQENNVEEHICLLLFLILT